MNGVLPYQLLADATLVLHVALVVFIVAGLVLIIAGNLRGWRIWLPSPSWPQKHGWAWFVR